MIPVVERIRAERVVAILRRVADPDALVDALAAGGVGVVEITLDSIGALAAIRRLRARGDVSVLAGTVRTAAQAEAAIEAGAEACVGPGLVLEVVERCRAVGVPVVPGALTPTEVDQAWGMGASLVKLFPARLGGPAYVRELLAPLAEVPLLATGGITGANLREFLDAGAVAVGMGSAFTGAEDPEATARWIMTAARR